MPGAQENIFLIEITASLRWHYPDQVYENVVDVPLGIISARVRLTDVNDVNKAPLKAKANIRKKFRGTILIITALKGVQDNSPGCRDEVA